MYHIDMGYNPTTGEINDVKIDIDYTYCVLNFDKIAEIESKSEYCKELLKTSINSYMEFLKSSMPTNDMVIAYKTLVENDILVRVKYIKRTNASKLATLLKDIEKDDN